MNERAAELADMADTYLSFERLSGMGEAGRRATRDMLASDARRLGFAPAEIEAAIDNAIATASAEAPAA